MPKLGIYDKMTDFYFCLVGGRGCLKFIFTLHLSTPDHQLLRLFTEGGGGEWGKSVGVGGKEYGECEVEFHLKIQYK